jgi:hypothetical protein
MPGIRRSTGYDDRPRVSVFNHGIPAATHENFPRDLASVVNAKPGGEATIQLTGGITLLGGVTYNSITFYSGTAAGATMLNQWFAIYSTATGAKLAVTADDTSTAWGANTAKTLTLSTPYTPAEDTSVWIGITIKTNSGTIPDIVQKTVATVIPTTTAPNTAFTADASLTDPASAPATLGTKTNVARHLYCHVN